MSRVRAVSPTVSSLLPGPRTATGIAVRRLVVVAVAILLPGLLAQPGRGNAALARNAEVVAPPTTTRLALGAAPGGPTAITATGTFTDTEGLVLRRAVADYMTPPGLCPADIEASANAWSYGCMWAAGHSFAIRIARFHDDAEARVAFDTARENREQTTFHDYPAFAWQRDEQPENPQMPRRYRYHTWVAHRWLIAVWTFDDTITGAGPGPTMNSEAVFEAATAFALFAVDPAPADAPEAEVLRDALTTSLAPIEGCAGGVVGTGQTWSLQCWDPEAGWYGATIRLFGDEAAARAAFDADGAGLLRHDFHGSDAYRWRLNPSPYVPRGPKMQRGHTWHVDRWVVTSETLDTGNFDILPGPLTIAERVFLAAEANGLFAAGSQADPLGVEWLGARGGAATAVGVGEDNVFVTAGRHFIVLDVSDRTNPHSVGGARLAGTGEDIALWGDRAIVALGAGGLAVVDVSHPTQPVVVSTVVGPAWSVAVAGDLLFVAEGASHTVWWVDLTETASWTPIGTTEMLGDVQGISVEGHYLYMASWDGGLQVVDVSDPREPVTVGRLGVPAVDVAAQGGLAYLAAQGSTLRVVDVSDPAAPVEVASHTLWGSAQSLAVANGQALVGHSDGEVEIVDVSDPRNPSTLGTYAAPGGYACDGEAVGRQNAGPALRLADGVAYVAERGAGLHVVDLTDPGSPHLVARYAWSGCVSDVAVAGEYAFLGAADAGLSVLHLVTPESPIEVAALDSIVVGRLFLAGNYLYATHTAGVAVIDISNPFVPVVVGAMDIPDGIATAVFVVDGHAYVTALFRGLLVFDVRDPAAPRLVGDDNTGGMPWDVRVAGDFAYVARGSHLEVVEVSDPAAPRQVATVGTVATGGSWERVRLVGAHAYVLDVRGQLHILDVSQPTAPVAVGTYDIDVTALEASGNRVFLAGGDGVLVLDPADPRAPRVVASLDAHVAQGALGTAVSGDHAYIALGEGGLVTVATGVRTTVESVDRQVLRRVAGTWDGPPVSCPTELTGAATEVSYHCAVAAGHALGAWIRVYGSAFQAGLAFESYRRDRPLVDFHGLPACKGQHDENAENPNLPLRHREHVWQSGKRVYAAYALDDTLPTSAPDPADVAERLYEAAMANGLVVAPSASQPVDVVLLATLPGSDPGSVARDVRLTDRHAYVAAGDGGLRIVDIAEPTVPTEVGVLAERVDTLALGDGLVYAVRSGVLSVVDVRDPTHPAVVHSTQTITGTDQTVAVAGGYAYVTGGEPDKLSHVMAIVDVRDPAAAQPVGSFGWETPFRCVDVAGGHAYALDDDSLIVLDLADPTIPTFVTTYHLPGSPWRVRVANDHAYAVDRAGMLQVIDVSDPAAPRLVGAHPAPRASGIALADDLAYLAGEGFRMLDVTSPRDPLRAAHDGDLYGVGLDVRGSIVAVAGEERGMTILRIRRLPASIYLPFSCRTCRLEP